MQDLYDTLRSMEDDPENMDEEFIVSGAGKEQLGGGVLVGLTITLNNAKVAFEARTGPSYIQCNISGGNLVAVDDVGASMGPIEPTAFTQIVLANSSSATLQELGALQYSSFNGGVSLDIVKGSPGTDFPIGTVEYPVDNLTQALEIANERGFDTIFINSSMTGANKIDSGSDLTGFTLKGKSNAHTQIEIDTSTLTENLCIRDCDVVGVLDGMNSIVNCYVGDLVYFNGFIQTCGLYGTIYLDGAEKAVIEDCFTVDQDNPPVIDMGDSGQSLAMPNYSGLVTIQNLDDASQEIGIGLNSGAVILDSTIVNGTVIISGVGRLTDNSGPLVNVNTDGLLNNEQISVAVWDEPTANHIGADTMGLGLKGILQLLENRYEVNEATSELWLYNDAGDTVIKKWPLLDKDGNAIVLQGTGPSDRLKRTL